MAKIAECHVCRFRKKYLGEEIHDDQWYVVDPEGNHYHLECYRFLKFTFERMFEEQKKLTS